MGARNQWVDFETVTLGGHRIAAASRADLAAAMAADCRGARTGANWPRLVFDVNGQGVSLYHSDPVFRAAVDAADLIHADGGFLVGLSRFGRGRRLPERTATTDLIHDCARVAEAEGLRFYLLGGEEDVNAGAARELQRLYPRLVIAGRRHGFFSPDDELEIIAEINRTKADVLFVGLGKPKEQVFSIKWRPLLTCGWIVTCGGCYNYITGAYARAPQLMQRLGFEWLFRAFTSRRLFWRYLTTNPHALWVTLRGLL